MTFDPNHDTPEMVRQSAKALRESVLTMIGAQRAGYGHLRTLDADRDLSDEAKTRKREEVLKSQRESIEKARAAGQEALRTFHAEAERIAEERLAPKSALPDWPARDLSDDQRLALQHQRAAIAASQDVSRRLAQDRVDRLLEAAVAQDDGAGTAILQLHERIRAEGDELALDLFERTAPSRIDEKAPGRTLLESAIREARFARLPEEVRRLRDYSTFLSPVGHVLEGVAAEAKSEDFFERDGGTGAVRVLHQSLGPDLAEFIGLDTK